MNPPLSPKWATLPFSATRETDRTVSDTSPTLKTSLALARPPSRETNTSYGLAADGGVESTRVGHAHAGSR
eukprot:8149616-Lingulodinium_polyedra.AAC.1